MEELLFWLLNFAVKNPILAIILVAFLSFLLRGGRGSPPKRGGMPPFGGEGPFPPPFRPGEPPVRPARPVRPVRPVPPERPMPTARPVPSGQRGGRPRSEAPAGTAAATPADERRIFVDKPLLIEETPAADAKRPEFSAAEKERAAEPKAETVSELKPLAAPQSVKAGIHAKNAVQGMIWSVLLGPPRALKPHRVYRKR